LTGLERLAAGGIDVVLLDLGLPDSVGLDTFTTVNTQAPQVPILVLTGLDDEALAVQVVQQGAQDYLVKGQADGDSLARAIRYAIERKRAEETIRQLAYHDFLTGLPNRRLFHDRLNVEIARAHRNRQKLAVMLLDLDNFKDVNDTLGHSVGDQLLQAVGERLTSLLRQSDTVARMGGDEFMLILPESDGDEDAVAVAVKVLEAFRKPFEFDGHEIRITTSVGIALYPDDGEDWDTLMKNVDIAMYRAKDRGRDNVQRYAGT
jgi:diguanylate cyclase (GGDEF)-like protein